MTAELIERLERGETGEEVAKAVGVELRRLLAERRATEDQRQRSDLLTRFDRLHEIAFRRLAHTEVVNFGSSVRSVSRYLLLLEDQDDHGTSEFRTRTDYHVVTVMGSLLSSVMALKAEVDELRAALLKAEAK